MRNRFGSLNMQGMLHNTAMRRGLIFGFILLIGMILFEISNFFSTFLGLKDILGSANLLGVRWSLILGFAFCAVDLAGLGRLFTPEQGRDEPAEVWYLTAAWLLAAGFDAFLTWLAVKVAIATNAVPSVILSVVPGMIGAIPIIVAAFELLIRITLISAFSVAGDRLFSQAAALSRPAVRPEPRPANTLQNAPHRQNQNQPTYRPVGGPTYRSAVDSLTQDRTER